MTIEKTLRDQAADWIIDLISGSGFGDDFSGEEVAQWADDLLSSDLVRRIRREAGKRS